MKRYKIGIIGAGLRSVFFVNEILKKEKLEIAAIADIEMNNMDHLCNIYEKKWDKYLNYKDLLEREDIEGIVLATPDYMHEEHAVEILRAGKHLFLEKPIAVTLEGARRIIKERNRSGKILIVGFVLRYNNLYKKMKELIDSGIIGEVKSGWVLHSVGTSSEWFFHDWHCKMENTGGLLIQKGSHDFDIINWIANSKVKKIAAMGSLDFFGGNNLNELECQNCKDRSRCSEAIKGNNVILRKYNGKIAKIVYNQRKNKCAFREEINVLDNYQVLLEYENGVKASYFENHYTPDDNREYIFIGTKGKLILNDEEDTITLKLRNGMQDRKEKIVYENLKALKWHGDGNSYILDDFISAMGSGINPNASGEAGLDAIEIAITAHMSIISGEVKYLIK
ncbi:Gfo/Idh/MocA family oxidoreductase [Clostridium sp. YIM B02515]|uniref:Gfo/Idh/MocA family oxidoreductase n=1 Tax=Clostridium rhizosphaerae TaxID=2803861 RepID=A0ABS1T971_9CLOT|nr:Gfo/Idh/MocA family oxidoreductase [Clostridium rhizosphaerae]MBL4935882.1 Gfo/Idh/MocA family oxidoreductase [Clostridium rhizosphaerae]